MSLQTSPTGPAPTPRFAAAEEGGMTIFGMFLFVTMVIIGGFALDVTNLYAARTQLQVASDLVAHAALYNRDSLEAEKAKEEAINVVYSGMPQGRYGEVLTPEDIRFGRYDRDSDSFTVDEASREAVLVSTARLAETGNPVASYLLRMIGFDNFDIRTAAIYTTFRPMCFREGFVAQGVVDMQSNNGFSNGFCIHSNSYVAVNSNNTFEAGTIVSMPNTEDIDLPQSGFETNAGLQAALRSGAYRLRILNKLDQMIAGLRVPGSPYLPPYITSSQIVMLNGKIDETDFLPNRIHVLTCSNGKVTIGGLIRNAVIVTSCEVTFANGAILEDVVVATSATGSKSMTSPNGFQVGRDDDCAPGGGAQLLTKGSMDFASGLQLYGGQLIAAGDINFAANADGITGASMIAGGRIDGTSNMAMGFCGNGMENNYEAEYFRLAR